MKKFSNNSIILTRIGNYITQNLKDRSDSISKLWMDHCEYIVAQRFRRGQQMISLYSRIWEDRALKELFSRLRKQVQKHAKGVMLGSVGVYAFDWDLERISFDSIKKHLNEIDYVKRLKKDTLECQQCGKRIRIFSKVEGIEYCSCPKNNCKSSKCTESWMPYIEQKDMITWRREEKPGFYSYKVYVRYADITAEDFLRVQTDVKYRQQWDKTAITLDIVDTDPNSSNSQIVYWEMLWPRLFANRDYVYNRKFFIDRQKNVIIIVNKSVEHPCCPLRPHNQRVQDYWSYMVIKPDTTFKKPGLEFVLTYYDNPGVSIPPAITSYVAQRQMPDFLDKLHRATIEYAAKKRKNDDEIFESWGKLRDPGYEYPPEQSFETQEKMNKQENSDLNKETKVESNESDLEDEFKEDLPEQKTQTTSWWSYLHPYYYFA